MTFCDHANDPESKNDGVQLIDSADVSFAIFYNETIFRLVFFGSGGRLCPVVVILLTIVSADDRNVASVQDIRPSTAWTFRFPCNMHK